MKVKVLLSNPHESTALRIKGRRVVLHPVSRQQHADVPSGVLARCRAGGVIERDVIAARLVAAKSVVLCWYKCNQFTPRGRAVGSAVCTAISA